MASLTTFPRSGKPGISCQTPSDGVDVCVGGGLEVGVGLWLAVGLGVAVGLAVVVVVAAGQDRYFAAVRDTIGRYGGRLEKFIGDAAMAVFGVPRARDDDAERAVRAGLALISAVQQLGADMGLEDDVLRLRVGINSGE